MRCERNPNQGGTDTTITLVQVACVGFLHTREHPFDTPAGETGLVSRSENGKYPLKPFFCDCARRKTHPFNGSTVQKGKGVIRVTQPESWVPAGDETGEE